MTSCTSSIRFSSDEPLHDSFIIEPDSTDAGTDLSTLKKIRGKASYYSSKFIGRATASGDRYNPKELTGAHRSLPFGTKIRVTNTRNQKSVIVTINDRGPHKKDRIVDVSRIAAEELDMIIDGIIDVEIEILEAAPEK